MQNVALLLLSEGDGKDAAILIAPSREEGLAALGAVHAENAVKWLVPSTSERAGLCLQRAISLLSEHLEAMSEHAGKDAGE